MTMLVQIFVPRIRVYVVTPKSHHQLLITSNLLPNSSSASISSIHDSNFTVDYLIHSCGLSREYALKASKRLQLKSPTRPDSVISLFKHFDIPKPQISKLIVNFPAVLLVDPNKTLKPKLEFLTSIGMSGHSLGKLLSNNNNWLKSSLEKKIIPCITSYKSLVHTDSNVVKVLSRTGWSIENAECKMSPNIALLRDHGVTESKISKFIMDHPLNLLIKPDKFNKVVMELEKMGVTHSNNMFLHCLHVLLAMQKPKWDAKLAVYKSFGWSEDEVLSMFKRQPFTMAMSEKKIGLGMDFLMNNLNWTQADIARNPTVLTLSLERRVIPRSYILQILLSKGLINKVTIGQALRLAEDGFMEKFIIKYHHQLPELLKLYQSKMGS